LLAVEQQAATRQAVGFVQLYPSFSSVRMQPVWILNDLFVALQARRGGVGRLLLAAAAGMARSAGACRLVLATPKDNAPAKALYDATGYRLDDRFDHYELPLDPSCDK